MQFDILTIFPDIFCGLFSNSLLKRAQERGAISIHTHDIREHATGPHRPVDDIPYGGGAGMVFKPEPIVTAVQAIKRLSKSLRILLTPRGRLLTQAVVQELTQYDQLILVCGRYEGVDERVSQTVIDEEISIGDYVLAGGEAAAMVVVEALSRLIPGVVGKKESVVEESFQMGLLEYPHYTRPPEFRGLKVPEVLLSGNHKEIKAWRRKEALKLTAKRRPELLKDARLTEDEKTFLRALHEGKEGETWEQGKKRSGR